MSPARFRVSCDPARRLYFVRDRLTGRCRGFYETPWQAVNAARRCERTGRLCPSREES